MSDLVEPFAYHVPQAALDDLNARLDMARWPERETVDDWSQGVPLAALKDYVAYWRNGYDWRKCEAWLNETGLFTTTIDGLDIRFLHVRSRHEGATPLILTHGWPGSILEFLGVIAGLTDPESHGGRAGVGFHPMIPRRPGVASSLRLWFCSSGECTCGRSPGRRRARHSASTSSPTRGRCAHPPGARLRAGAGASIRWRGWPRRRGPGRSLLPASRHGH